MTETAFRTFGGLLGLVGVLLVAYELDAAIGQYSPMHSAVRRTARRLRRLWGWLIMTYRRLVGRQPEPTVVGAMAASTSATAGRARGMVTPPKREHDDFDTDDERLRYLFDRVNSAHEWIGVVREKADADRARCRERQDHLAEKLADTDQRWRQKIRDVEAGQAGMRFSGFICLGFGVLSTSWADELSRWDPPAFGLLIVAWLSTLVWAWTREDISEE